LPIVLNIGKLEGENIKLLCSSIGEELEMVPTSINEINYLNFLT